MHELPETVRLEVKSTRREAFFLKERDLEGIREEGHLALLISDRSLGGPSWTLVPGQLATTGKLPQVEGIELGEQSPISECLNAGWALWLLDEDALDCLLEKGLSALRERLAWCRKHHAPTARQGPDVLREARLSNALKTLRERLDCLAEAGNGAQIEGHFHQILLEDALKEVGYRITSNPVGVPDVVAELKKGDRE